MFATAACGEGWQTPYMVKHKKVRSKACREVVVDASLFAAQKVGHSDVCVS